MIIPETGSWQLRDCERLITGNAGLLGQKHFLIGITRFRNEALILRDTLNYVGLQVDAIIAYDDASTDRTLEILCGHPKVALIVTRKTSRRAELQKVDIADFCCRLPVHGFSSIGCSASMRMNALPGICGAS